MNWYGTRRAERRDEVKMRKEGLLIVTRVSLAELHRRRPIRGYETRVPVLGLGHDEVARRYRGFHGEPWAERDWESEYPFLPESGLGSLNQFVRIREILTRDFGPDSDLIYLGGVEAPAGLPEGFTFVGYDYGSLWWVWGYYSVVLNEVIYGLHPTMREFATSLNEHLLLPSVEQTERLGAVRQSLLEQGVDCLETDSDEWYAVGIWLYARGGRGPT